jgi:electron transport complex protein RnfA
MTESLSQIFISTLLANNLVLAMFLGLCPFLGVSARLNTALPMGAATTFVMVVASLCAFALNWLVTAFNLEFLRLISYIVIIASAVQLVEMVLKKYSPVLFRALGIYLPLITTNCAVLGVALLNVQEKLGFVHSLLYGFGSALGFTLVLLLFAGLRERLALAQTPAAFAGAPIGFVVAGLLSLAFMGFAGLV